MGTLRASFSCRRVKHYDSASFVVGEKTFGELVIDIPGRQFCSRVSEHEDAVRKKNLEKSAFEAHLTPSGHLFDNKGGLRLLRCESHGRSLIALERLEIV